MININAAPKPCYELTEEELEKATGGRGVQASTASAHCSPAVRRRFSRKQTPRRCR